MKITPEVITSLLILMLSLLTAGGNASGEEMRISLADAVRVALEDNHELRALKNALASREEDIGIARSALLPGVAFEERFMRTDNPVYAFMARLGQGRFAQSDFAVDSLNTPKPINDFQTTLSFNQPLFAPKSNIGLTMAKLEYSAQHEMYARKREEIAARVIKAYLGVLTAKEFVLVSGQSLDDRKEHLRFAELRYKAGLALYSDTLRASTSLVEAEQKLVSARKTLNVAKRALAFLLGRDELIDVAGDRPDLPVMALEHYNALSQLRHDITSLEKEHENAKNALKLANAGYLPTIGAGGSYQVNDHRRPGSEGESWQLSASLRWELFDGTKREHERAKAWHRISEAEENLKGLRAFVSFQIYEAYLAVHEARTNADLASSALKTAEEGKRLVEVRYENSLSPLIDLLDAQLSLDQARANLIARENEYRTAVVNLGFESGTILEDLKMEE